MNLVRIKDGQVFKAVLAPSINLNEFLDKNKDYVLTDINIEKDAFYKYENGIVIKDLIKTNEYLIDRNKKNASFLIEYTNKYMTIDNIYGLTESQISELIEFRKKCLTVELEMPEIPDFIKS